MSLGDLTVRQYTHGWQHCGGIQFEKVQNLKGDLLMNFSNQKSKVWVDYLSQNYFRSLIHDSHVYSCHEAQMCAAGVNPRGQHHIWVQSLCMNPCPSCSNLESEMNPFDIYH